MPYGNVRQYQFTTFCAGLALQLNLTESLSLRSSHKLQMKVASENDLYLFTDCIHNQSSE